MANLDRNAIIDLYANRTSKCTHTNYPDGWGIGFDTVHGHMYIYSVPCGGLFAQDWDANITQISGTSQFSGINSKSVKNWLDNKILR